MNTHKVLSLTLAVALLTAAQASALDTFRGIVKDQASIGQPDNTHISPSMDRVDHKWNIDLEDNFNAYPTRSFGPVRFTFFDTAALSTRIASASYPPRKTIRRPVRCGTREHYPATPTTATGGPPGSAQLTTC